MEGKGTWNAIEGYFALTGFEFDKGNGNVFNPSFGVPVKVFMNTTTGEIRVFSAYFFQS